MLNHIKKSVRGVRKSKPVVLETDDFAALYRDHVDAVFNYCFFRLGNRALAEDLTADTFERAWQARRRYQPDRADFTTWLFTIARRMITDTQRRNVRRPLVALSDYQPDGNPSPEAQIEQAERRHTLQRLVQSLLAHEKELIALKFGAGMTNRQMAQLLGKSETAIGSAIYRVVQKLRRQWQARQQENTNG